MAIVPEDDPETPEVHGNADVPGCFPNGIVTDIARHGAYWRYRWNGKVVVVHDTGDDWAGHILDSSEFEIAEYNGQSWNTIDTYKTPDLDYGDPTGMTRARMERWADPTVAVTRRATSADVSTSPYHAVHPFLKKANSTEIEPVVDLHRMPMGARLSTGWVAAATRAHFQREWGLPQRGTIATVLGRAGQSATKFIPEGTSFRSDRSKVYAAELVKNASEYLWAVDNGVRAEIEAFVASVYMGRTVVYDQLCWIQGTYKEPGAYRAFLNLFRKQQNQLGLRTDDGTGIRSIFIDQRASCVSEPTQQIGAWEQLQWAQANASGKDFLFAPRYWVPQKDGTHHSCYGALRLGEAMGLAQAIVDLTGTYQPFWFTKVSASGREFRIATNAPAQGGGIVFDTTTVTAIAHHGFTIREDANPDKAVALRDVSIDGDDIVLTANEAVDDRDLRVEYAWRGSVGVRGTEANPNQCSVRGNVKRTGTCTGPFSDRPIDQWLCAMRAVHTPS